MDSEMSLEELFNAICDRQTSLNALKTTYVIRKSKESGKTFSEVDIEMEKRIAIKSLPKIKLE